MKKALKYLAFLLLAGILLHFSFKGVKWSDFISGLQSCNWWWIAASMAIGILGFLFRALRWRILLRAINKDVTLGETFNGINIGYITNFIFPRAGEVARCGVIANTRKVSFEKSLGTVVLERSLDMVCLLLWMFLLLLFTWGEFGSFIKGEILQPLQGKFSSLVLPLSILCAVAVAGCAALWIFRKRLMEIKIVGRIMQVIKGLLEGVFSAFRMEEKWMFFLYTLLIWLTYWLTSLTTIYAFPQVGHLNGIDALFLMIIGGFGWVVPVQGGLGAYHFIVSLALAKVYGIAQATGVVFATISHEAQALVMILCGAVSLISVSMWKKSSKNKL
ncbi:MAG: flippase-like domain-containing protein [Bacteroidales bacterium]|nr:flippase-like domain-containing protein [Bacteroidales bacterium]MBQ5827577.1 flippase-like domain-containing protein [Bacteroidales bacterium]